MVSVEPEIFVLFSDEKQTKGKMLQDSLSTYRKLHDEEIGQLIHQGCTSNDWNLVRVAPDFIPDSVQNTRFSGRIRLNRFDGHVQLVGGIQFKTGIYNAWLHNCEVGRNALIHNVRSYIANYIIEEQVVIHNVTTIAVDGISSFGNGTVVETINEGGGREVPIHDFLSAHTAYMMALYRHRPKLVATLQNMVDEYVRQVTDDMGLIGHNSRILNCNTVLNVKVGPFSSIDGAKKLKNGSINSNVEAPVKIGEGVIMDDFIVSSGSEITDATLVSKCFIGQGCALDKHYSAENSLFFANCQGIHGEACSIFAGPYTVTHHKSTLLIAGLYSFLNAGSGSNQSNHLYKLGPIHQGILERGTKTTSDSYLLWPSHIGAFTLVMGRHYKHCDTTDFPFSYLIERNDESVLVPGINLKSIGTIRDTQKWPQRDRRKDSNLLDLVNFNLLSPYTIHKMVQGRDKLLELQEKGVGEKGVYQVDKMIIESHALERGIHLYEMAIWKFLGNSLITQLSGGEYAIEQDIRQALASRTNMGKGKWIDLAGMICPFEGLDQLLTAVEETPASLEELNSGLKMLHNNYYNYEWTWAADCLHKEYGKAVEEFTAADVIQVVQKWLSCVLQIDQYLYEDAKKEFSIIKMTGFGVDGREGAKEEDFVEVRGEFERNKTVMAIQEHMEKKTKLGESIIEMMESVQVPV